MLQQLADLKCLVQDLGSHESHLTESEWAEVKMMVEVLQIPHAATIYFQNKMNDFQNKILSNETDIFTPGECFCDDLPISFVDIIFNSILVSVCAFDFI